MVEPADAGVRRGCFSSASSGPPPIGPSLGQQGHHGPRPLLLRREERIPHSMRGASTMLRKDGVAKQGTSGRNNRFSFSCPTLPRTSGPKAGVRELSGLGVLMLLAVCVNGCAAMGLATGAASVAGHAGNNRGSKSQTATNTPSATGQSQENVLPAIRHELAVG